jgi:hypothetical protein
MLIPQIDYELPGPGWIPRDDNGEVIRPLIKCACGNLNTASAHHIHADGRVTASYYHAKEPIPSQNWAGGGCGFHEFLELANWTGQEFPPNVYQVAQPY